MLLGMRSLWTAYLSSVREKPSDMGLGLMDRSSQKEYGGYERWKVFVMFVVHLLAWESAEEKKGMLVKENGHVSRSLEG